MKSYNTRALRGEDYDDVEFQRDMRGSNIHIPDSLLFKREMNDYVLNEIRKQTITHMTNDVNPHSNKPYSEEEAIAEANKLYNISKNRINTLVERSNDN